ncbi:MAG: sensor histidine kinase [Hyphomicrobium sp.]
MFGKLSLRNRLIAVSTAWIIFGVVIAWFVLSAVFQQHVRKQFEDELFVHIEELERLSDIHGDKVSLFHNLSDPRYEVLRSGYYWEIQKGGQVLARSPSMVAGKLVTPPDKPTDSGVHLHVIPGPTGTMLAAEQLHWPTPNDTPVQYIIGTDERHIEEVISSFNHTLSWALSGFGISMVAAAGLLIAYAMQPMNELHSSLLRVRSGDAKSLEGKFPVEVQPVVDDLNGLLSSTSDLVQRARAQAGNIAHSLKTPLAILTDEAYRIADQGLTASSATILEQCRKMQSHIDYQTTRARVVANRLAPGTWADARENVEEVFNAMRRLHKGRSIEFRNEVPEGIRLSCDRQDLHEILANLIDNAAKHAKTTVLLRCKEVETPSNIELCVEDDGPGLPPEAYEVVFNIGERWDTQVSGSGLGLAIARDLAQLYSGDISLETSKLGGLAAVLTLPRPKVSKL